VAGYIPVLAHPSVICFITIILMSIETKRAGCLFQLNLSVVGYYGPQITKIGEQLLAKGMYNYVGSDSS
jgi:tyrosine-protein phosphatase YwqE